MSDMSKVEAMKAAREAQDSVVSSPRTSSTTAVEAAMKRYLSAEQYHELAAETRTDEQEQAERTD
jgi:hypothetical protein